MRNTVRNSYVFFLKPDPACTIFSEKVAIMEISQIPAMEFSLRNNIRNMFIPKPDSPSSVFLFYLKNNQSSTKLAKHTYAVQLLIKVTCRVASSTSLNFIIPAYLFEGERLIRFMRWFVGLSGSGNIRIKGLVGGLIGLIETVI